MGLKGDERLEQLPGSARGTIPVLTVGVAICGYCRQVCAPGQGFELIEVNVDGVIAYVCLHHGECPCVSRDPKKPQFVCTKGFMHEGDDHEHFRRKWKEKL